MRNSEIGKKESCLKYNTPTHNMINCFSCSGCYELLLKPWGRFRTTLKAMKRKIVMSKWENLFEHKRFHVFNYRIELLSNAEHGELNKAFHHCLIPIHLKVQILSCSLDLPRLSRLSTIYGELLQIQLCSHLVS